MAAKTNNAASKRELEATIKRLEGKLERTDARADRWKKQAKRHEADASKTPAATHEVTTTPDASWTVDQLRTEARSRGLIGMTRKSKAELIAAPGAHGATS